MSEPTGEPLLELVRVMNRLRSPGGCPWDAEQTHQSLVEFLVERIEAHGGVRAVQGGPDRFTIRLAAAGPLPPAEEVTATWLANQRQPAASVGALGRLHDFLGKSRRQ